MANPIDPSIMRRRPGEPDPVPEPRSDQPPAGDDELPATDEETAARALRDAAWMRYETFSSSGPQDSTIDCRTGAEYHDFDHCGTKRMRDPVLFHAESARVPAATAADVNQESLGDCALMAVLAGFASRPEGRAQLRKMIAENKDQSGHVVSYTVTLQRSFYLREFFGRSWDHPLFSKAVKIRVLPEYAIGHAAPGRDGRQAVVWPVVIEKAFATFFGGYNAIARSGSAQTAFQVLTGNRGRFVELAKVPNPAEEIAKALDSGKIVVLNTPANLAANASAFKLVDFHSYLVTAMTVNDAGERCVLLHNPWNYDEPDPVPIKSLAQWLCTAQIGSVDGGAPQ